jgi:hypothetical protein
MKMNEETISKISDGPYEWAVIPEGPDQMDFVRKNIELGSGPIHAVWLPKHPGSTVGADPTHPEHAVFLCMTGNGPNAKNNAHALLCLLNQREVAKTARDKPLPIPTTPDAVAWSEYAMVLEHALGIATPIPEALRNADIAKRCAQES